MRLSDILPPSEAAFIRALYQSRIAVETEAEARATVLPWLRGLMDGTLVVETKAQVTVETMSPEYQQDRLF